MATRKPTPSQGQLQLQLYDLRREARLRQARDWFFVHYQPRSLEESTRLTPPGSDQNAFARMVLGYWDQACALLNYGLLHEDLFFETSGEFYAVWENVSPVVAGFRKEYRMPHFLAHLEKAARRYEKWLNKRAPGCLPLIRQRRQQMRAAMAAAQKA